MTGYKIEDAWRRNPRDLVCCTARLSRPLLPKESQRVERLLKTRVEGTELVHECRREELEEWKTRLVDALSGVSRAAERRAVAAGERRRRSTSAARNPQSPEPAA